MTVGILIIAHGDIGPALIGAASHVLGRNLAEERVASLRAGHDEAREDFLAQAQARVADLDSGEGELLLPGRVAGAAGVSLPMLLRAVNYRQLPLEALRDKALTAATECSAPLP